MSFTSEIKKEICKEEIDAQMMKAQLCALFQMRASLHMNWQGMYLSFQTENATIAKHVFQIMKTLYDVDPRLSVLKKMKLKKNNIYRIQVFSVLFFPLFTPLFFQAPQLLNIKKATETKRSGRAK